MHLPSGRTAWVTALVALALAACGPSPSPTDARPGDATRPDAVDDTSAPPADVPEDAQRCTGNAECSNGTYCDGEERCQGGFCVAGRPPCDDGHTCTTDSCDEAARMCTNAPDDAMCGDRNACNGVERCNPTAPGAVPATGCEPVRPDNITDCDDSNTCTIDSCDPAGGCVHAPRDLDGDGFVDRACTIDGTPSGPAGDDCNDGDETVFPGAPEICNDSRDNNCDGRTDYADATCLPTNDTCATATMLPGPGTYSGSTVGLRDDYALSCNTGSNADAVFVFTLASPQDVTVTTSGGTGSSSAVAIVSDCAAPLSEVRCNHAAFGGSPALRIHSLPAGTYRIIVETGAPATAFRLTLRYDAPTPTPAEDVCPSGSATTPAVELMSGVATTAHLSTLEDDHLLSCNSFGTASRDAVYRITLTALSDVRVVITPPSTGFSSTYVSFRGAPCAASASERRCTSTFSSTPITVLQRALTPGTYWVIVENSMDADVGVTATISPAAPVVTYTATVSPPGVSFFDVCAAAGSTRVLTLVDDAQAAIPMTAVPFPVRFYGNAITTGMTVSSNGWASMTPSAGGSLSGTVPDPSTPNLTMALFWNDLYTRSTGICYGATGTAPNRRFVIQWQDEHFCCSPDPAVHLTFEAVINEQASASGNNFIDYVYQTLDGASGRMPGAGIENEDGTIGTLVPAPLTAPRVIRFTPSM